MRLCPPIQLLPLPGGPLPQCPRFLFLALTVFFFSWRFWFFLPFFPVFQTSPSPPTPLAPPTFPCPFSASLGLQQRGLLPSLFNLQPPSFCASVYLCGFPQIPSIFFFGVGRPYFFFVAYCSELRVFALTPKPRKNPCFSVSRLPLGFFRSI